MTLTGDDEGSGFYIQRDYCMDAEAQTPPCVTSVQKSDEIKYYGDLKIHIGTEATTNVIVLRRAKKMRLHMYHKNMHEIILSTRGRNEGGAESGKASDERGRFQFECWFPLHWREPRPEIPTWTYNERRDP